MMTTVRPVGELLREWRQRRRKSQLALACDADISTRHLSFLETGRSAPSRDMVLALAEELEVPLRERNALLMAAGFAPMFPERPLTDPALDAARTAVELVLRGFEPFPALAVNRHWTLISANRGVSPFLADVEPSLLQPPVNVLRLSLHPAGLASRIANLRDWHAHVVARLRRQSEASGDPRLAELLAEIEAYPHQGTSGASATGVRTDYSDVAVPFQLVSGSGVLSFYTTTMVFGTPIDVTLSELAIEAFFPADAATAKALATAT
jgi:transcriptional regulator with XRE-family HTH domain